MSFKHIRVDSNILHLQASGHPRGDSRIANVLARPIPIQQGKSPCKHTSNLSLRCSNFLGHHRYTCGRYGNSACPIGRLNVVTHRRRMDGWSCRALVQRNMQVHTFSSTSQSTVCRERVGSSTCSTGRMNRFIQTQTLLLLSRASLS